MFRKYSSNSFFSKYEIEEFFIGLKQILGMHKVDKVKVQNVSFPRSGHHLLINILLRYFSRNLDFKITDGRKSHLEAKELIEAGVLIYCEYYNHCRQTPCIDPRATFMKNHDFSQNLHPRDFHKLIVQYRHPFKTLVSFYEFENSKIPSETDKDLWRKFSNVQLRKWQSFILKWVLENNNHSSLFVKYENLVQDPKSELLRVLEYIKLEREVDLNFIDEIVFGYKVKESEKSSQVPQELIEEFNSWRLKNLPLLSRLGYEAEV